MEALNSYHRQVGFTVLKRCFNVAIPLSLYYHHYSDVYWRLNMLSIYYSQDACHCTLDRIGKLHLLKCLHFQKMASFPDHTRYGCTCIWRNSWAPFQMTDRRTRPILKSSLLWRGKIKIQLSRSVKKPTHDNFSGFYFYFFVYKHIFAKQTLLSLQLSFQIILGTKFLQIWSIFTCFMYIVLCLFTCCVMCFVVVHVCR